MPQVRDRLRPELRDRVRLGLGINNSAVLGLFLGACRHLSPCLYARRRRLCQQPSATFLLRAMVRGCYLS